MRLTLESVYGGLADNVVSMESHAITHAGLTLPYVRFQYGEARNFPADAPYLYYIGGSLDLLEVK